MDTYFSHVTSLIHEYNAENRSDPKEIPLPTCPSGSVDDESKLKDFAWLIARYQDPVQDDSASTNPQTVPAWSGFNAIANKDKIPSKSVVGYCQLIDASPTELSTVYTLLKRSVEMATQLGLSDTVVVLDQAIYAKALEVVWRKKAEFKSVVLRMGSFHITCTFLAVIGKRFEDSGLRDLLLESGLVGTGSLNGVLGGKHYNRALRIHKVITVITLRSLCDYSCVSIIVLILWFILFTCDHEYVFSVYR